ncbi:hypothetical protein [Acetohalobium arabaticum]|uniref:Lipoprotein n=1 Tax=Acetohalobium arabaticum (strain ATCC 49924 / DSM 5501 / Z-7288) TaxID=574087 RepID=D9QU71_ACEAZ|nr:hypothetical protein [Acetohalobium arabaticum]ADL11864.1 hypothetical protein Acear_0315 [Acetohalobium arabaticum DSM 5501]
MKRRITVLIIVLIILVSGCTAKEIPGEKDKPSREVPQPDEFNDPYGSEAQRKRLIHELDDLIRSDY